MKCCPHCGFSINSDTLEQCGECGAKFAMRKGVEPLSRAMPDNDMGKNPEQLSSTLTRLPFIVVVVIVIVFFLLWLIIGAASLGLGG